MSWGSYYRTISLTPEQLDAAHTDLNFVKLRDAETQGMLEALYKQLYPVERLDELAAQRPLWPTRTQFRIRAWAWRVRRVLGRPLHWLAAKISPGGCDCEV